MSPSRSEPVSDGAVLAVIACLAAAGAALWLWAGLAGALFGHGWAGGGIGELLGAATRLPSHLADPARAWPAPDRSRLPGPEGFYGALVVLLGAGAAFVIVARRAGVVLPAARRDRGARWAGDAELRSLRGRGRPDDGNRLVLGHHRGRLLRAERRHALVAFGPPQSGKSAGLAVPALLEWRGPAVASSIKTDLLSVTVQRRRRLGRVFVFDPFALSGGPSDTWSPLNAARTWDGALEVAWRLASAGELDHKGVEGGDFWAVAAEQRLAPLLYTAARTDSGIEALVRWAYGQAPRELDQALARVAGEASDDRELADAHAAYDAVRAFELQADRTRSSIEATAQALLRAYRFARVAQSAQSCEITADRLLDEAATLYLIGDAKASRLLRPIFLALVSEIVDRAYQRATLAGGQLRLPLLLCLDEAGNVAPLPNLAEIASTAPSHNIQLLSIFHDLAQARSRYGRQAETVINSHRARMLLPGVADLDTLRYFAGLVGDEDAPDMTRTTGAGGTSRSSGRRRRPLASAEALRQLPEGQALLVYGRIAPARVRLRLWFADRRLKRIAGTT
ncbi:MAG TPA: type IV secretory system conjugative DNA transfer family protein [Solirubrobacteraceae bacterium]|jgi:type IV secretory pathway TraG/TraD family ATPase VirD4